jgi:hypothetical protein
MLNKKVAAWIIIAVVFIFGLLVARAFAETTKKIENSLGVSEIYQGRYSYLVALPKDGQILDGKFTNIRFSPWGEPDLYDVSVLFCGDVTEQFQGKQGVLAIAYETRAHAMYKSVACHELLGVSELK